jgi:hypothetical protein
MPSAFDGAREYTLRPPIASSKMIDIADDRHARA